MGTKYKIVLLSSAVVLSLLILGGLNLSEDEAVIHIAFVGPLSGESAVVGQSMAQALQLYFNTINEQGGINQKKVVLDVFDDQNDANKAIKAAQEIVEQDRAVAVIGHNCSACSIKAGKEVYKKQGIPAVSPVSTQIEVTQDNDWYFRTVFNDNLQARFLANYAKHFLQQQRVSLIYTDEVYGAYLASVFEKTSQALKIDIKYKWLLSSDNNLEPQIAQIVSELQTKADAGLIFLATYAPEGVKLVKLIRDAGIKNLLMAPDSYASKRFSEGFWNYKKEKLSPGYYTNGLYVSTPFILDTANRRAHYFNARYQEQSQEERLPWQAFSAVDAATVLIEALKQAEIQGERETLVADRQKIRDILFNYFNTPERAVEGNSGLIFFDEHGDAFKSVLMGVYKNNHLISAFNQLQIRPRRYEESDILDSALEEGRILLSDDQSLYKTDVVYTGIQLNSISDFNPKTVTYRVDFFLWFRFQGEIDPQKINFLNAVEPIQLGTAIIDEKIGKENYRLYRVKGHFNGNIHASEHQFFLNQHLLGISFRHRDLDQNRLSYATDVLGMDLMEKTSLLDNIEEIQERSALENWTIKSIDFFPGRLKKKLLGNPKYLVPGNRVEYSTFNADIWMSSNAYVYHALIRSEFVVVFLVFSAVMTLLLILVSSKDNQVNRLKYILFFQAIFAVMLLISTEIVVIHWMREHIHSVSIETFITAFNVLWWLIPAILLHIAVERFFWLPLEKKTGRTVPNLMRFLTALLIYLLALFGIIGFVFERPITSLLATSGVVAMIVGLAVQMNLSNIFSGIALNIERSLRIGDWVKIGTFDEGKVVNMNWRVTQIETRKGYILSIPNSTVSTSDIHNFSYPDDQYWLLSRVPLDPKHDPIKVEEILMNAVLSVEKDIVKDVKPRIWLENIQVENVSDWTATYVIFFKTENYQHKFRVLKNVWKSIWVHLNQAGIMPTTTIPALEAEQEQNIVLIPSQLDEVLSKNKLQNMMTSA